MKIREGFVSNSSSSSFICSISNQIFGGYDAEPHDFDLIECTKGHTFLQYKYQLDLETVPLDELKKEIFKIYTDNEELVLKVLVSDFDKYSKIVPMPTTITWDVIDSIPRLELINLYFILTTWAYDGSHWVCLNSLKNVDMYLFAEEFLYLPSSWCPICNLEYISDALICQYLEATDFNFDKEKIKNEIRNKFKTQQELLNVINSKRGKKK